MTDEGNRRLPKPLTTGVLWLVFSHIPTRNRVCVGWDSCVLPCNYIHTYIRTYCSRTQPRVQLPTVPCTQSLSLRTCAEDVKNGCYTYCIVVAFIDMLSLVCVPRQPFKALVVVLGRAVHLPSARLLILPFFCFCRTSSAGTFRR